jgi:hypothetical protein
MSIELLNLEEFEFENSEFSVFVSNNIKDNQIKQRLDQLAQVALEQQKADLSTIIDTVLNDSPKEIVNTLKRAEQEFYKRSEATQKAQQEHEQQMNQAKLEHEKMLLDNAAEEKQKDRDLQQYIADEKNRTAIEVQEIANYFKVPETDSNANSIPDPLEIGAQALKQQEINSKQFIEHQKLIHDKDRKEKEMSLKSKEIDAKIEIENKKIEQTKVQNASQEKLAREKHKSDQELANKKLDIERTKAKAAIKKSNQKPKK